MILFRQIKDVYDDPAGIAPLHEPVERLLRIHE